MSLPLEVCIDSAAGLTACAEGGADRIELCSALAVGGLTPSLGLMTLAAQQPIPVHVMIRPQAGGFLASGHMIDQMLADIAAASKLGLTGIVIGALTKDDDLDAPVLSDLIAAAGGMEVTLHRAFDLTRDPMRAMEIAIDLGIDRILTSGSAKTAPEGWKMLRDLVDLAAGRIRIAAGSGLTPENVGNLITRTGIDELHASCAEAVPAAARTIELGFATGSERATNARLIRQMKGEIDRVSS